MKTTITCTICNTNYTVKPKKCSKCDYPFSASEKDKSAFVGELFSKKLILENAKDKIKRAQKILWIIGSINIISFIAIFSINPTFNLNVLDLLLGFVFIGFGFYASKRPFRAIFISLVLLLFIYFLNALADPMLIIRGIILKIVFIVGLAYALSSVYKVQKIKNENDYFKEMK